MEYKRYESLLANKSSTASALMPPHLSPPGRGDDLFHSTPVSRAGSANGQNNFDDNGDASPIQGINLVSKHSGDQRRK